MNALETYYAVGFGGSDVEAYAVHAGGVAAYALRAGYFAVAVGKFEGFVCQYGGHGIWCSLGSHAYIYAVGTEGTCLCQGVVDKVVLPLGELH